MGKLNNFIKSRAFIITLTLIFIFLIIIGVTYAWFTWSSTDNTNITMQIGEYTTVTYVGGNAINVNNLAPVFNYTDGESTTFSLTNSNNSVLKQFTFNVYLDVTSIANELISSSLKYILLDGSSNIIEQGNFSTVSSGSTLTITENQSLPNGTSSYTFIIYIDGNEQNNSNMMNKSLTSSLRVIVNENIIPPINAATYITNLYTNATKSTATVNNITYNLASSVNLMNDRHASKSTDINGGDIRYYGADPDNYVWLGDTYASDITFLGNENAETPDIVRQAGDKKLWRIIGVFDGRVKLVSNDPISSTKGLSWDTSENNTTGGNSGLGINQWGESTYFDTGDIYTGADLMKLLNPGYEDNEDLDSSGNTITVNNSLYWNKGTGTVYTGASNATTSNVSFANTGLTATERNMIDSVTWYIGAYDNRSYVNNHYAAERGSMSGKICTQGGIWCNDTVTRTSTWNGKVGLIYASDYGYASDLSQCNQTLYYYDQTGCSDTNWLPVSKQESDKIMSMHASSGNSRDVFYIVRKSRGLRVMGVSGGGVGGFYNAAIYLKPNTMITDGNGTESNPYALSLSN